MRAAAAVQPADTVVGVSGTGRFFSSNSDKFDDPLKVEEAETVDVPPPTTEKLLVLGGNGFVGSHVCKAALDRGLSVSSLSSISDCAVIRCSESISVRLGMALSRLCEEEREEMGKDVGEGEVVGGAFRRKHGGSIGKGRSCHGDQMVLWGRDAVSLDHAASCWLNELSLPLWSGRSSITESWADKVIWHQDCSQHIVLGNSSSEYAKQGSYVSCFLCFAAGNLLSPDSLKDAFNEVTSVVSCVGGFGSNSHMYEINGNANINAVRAAAEHGTKRFVYISAADFGLANYVLKGYYDGKRAAETELLTKFPYGGVILRPGFIYGTRRVGSMMLPLGVIGSPLEMVLQHAKPLCQAPIVGPLFIPPVNVTAVAKVAVRAATDPVFPPGIIDVHSISRYSQQKLV
ncbi:hypothetical protein Ancab_010654 [Ancistrocladus abbreviatus]